MSVSNSGQQRFKEKGTGFVVLVVLSVGMFLLTNAFIYLYGINNVLSEGTLLLGLIDALLTFTLFALFFHLYRRKIHALLNVWRNRFGNKSSQLALMILALTFFSWLIWVSPNTITMIIDGVTRQSIVEFSGGNALVTTLASTFFFLSVVLVGFSSAGGKYKLILAVGAAFSIVVLTSRAGLMLLGLLFVIVYLIEYRPRKLLVLGVVGVVLVVGGSLVTSMVQNRPLESVFLGPLKPVEDLFLYRGYSYVLADVAAEWARDGMKFLFPFFGYFSERILIGLGLATHPVDSDFIVRFFVFDSDIRQHSANVVYPWWAWFYGAYGVAGLVFKAAYLFALLRLALVLRSFPLLILLIYWGLFSGFGKHPLISLDGYMMLFWVLIVDLISKMRMMRYRAETVVGS